MMPADAAPSGAHAENLPACPYRLEYATAGQLAAALPPDALGAVCFGAQPGAPRAHCMEVPLPVLAGESFGEVWRSVLPVQRFIEGELAGAENGELIFVQLSLPESRLEDLEQAVQQAYGRLTRLLIRHGYPHWLRAWNYLSDINGGGATDHERYRRFSAGRYLALAHLPHFEHRLPAASTIGTPAGSGLQIYLLASRHAATQVENPRQVSAFKYPRQYGPRSPSFSRGVLVHWQDRCELLVSGTASIVGHESRHADDPQAQLHQTLENLEALHRHASAGSPRTGPLAPVAAKLYLRDPADLPQVLPGLNAALGGIPLHVLGGDICRADLRLEIELMYASTGPRGRP